MNCREAENLIAAGVYGRLTPEERAELERHAGACSGCAALLEKWVAVLNLRDEAPEGDAPLPDWEKSWSRIAAEALDKRPRRRSVLGWTVGWSLGARRAAVAAAVTLVFVLGYFAGRGVLVHRPGQAVATAARGTGEVNLAEYADNLRPLLVDFLNRSGVRPPEELVELKRRVVRNMLDETRLLQRLAAERGESGLGDLLSDLEFILVSMANMDPDDRESADQLSRMIREKDVSLRLRDLAAFTTI